MYRQWQLRTLSDFENTKKTLLNRLHYRMDEKGLHSYLKLGCTCRVLVA